ncbi:MAG TPA: alpha/beta fold hydrolase [Patescibacteria group bacterium]|nr:alpha/beta fold hydrolase [Patescibacteria group bacterium]
MNKLLTIVFFFIIAILFVIFYKIYFKDISPFGEVNQTIQSEEKSDLTHKLNPLSIEYMRTQEYPGSNIVIEQTLTQGSNYDRYIASYKSDKLKIYALITIPQGKKPDDGWPVVIFNHGYIQPQQYKTTEKYITYTDVFSRNGYIVFKSDYRGHGNSEGTPESAYYSPAYTIDVLNAVSSIKKYKDSDPEKIGMWGHSMGGMITLRSMVVTDDIKAGVIWAGVTASYEDLANKWHRTDRSKRTFIPTQQEQVGHKQGRQELIDTYGNFDTNTQFWGSISPLSFVKDISGPIQLHHGTSDEQVPILFSQKLDQALKKVEKITKFFAYEGDNHNLSNNLRVALQRSVDFFDRYVKN